MTSPAPTARASAPEAPARSIALVRWFDSWAGSEHIRADEPQRVDWVRCIPFALMHLACFAVLWTGWSPFAVGWAVALYVVRMFAITGFYHRYFSHRTFKTTRAGQFAFALLGASSIQRGPLWWAAHHRRHHRHSDEPVDVHSPLHHGFLWSHIGWICSRANFPTHLAEVPDLAKYPELRFLDRFDILVPALLLGFSLGLGEVLQAWAPHLGVDGWQLLAWTVLSTVVLYHGTFTINSLSHVFGTRRFATKDGSRNNPILAVVTLGEGWHNNHHHYPMTARQGFRWWEYDPTWYGLVALSWLGLVWDLRPVPAHVLDMRRADR
jgi:stearoyl-CoA desaturase (delta-9 desaturase)